MGPVGIVGLRLGDGKITEGGLNVLGVSGLYTLALNSRQFTGICFKRWWPDISTLDLSGSAINDPLVAHLKNLPNLRLLFLAHTDLTDRALPHLAKLSSVSYIDLSGTRITADGLARADLQQLTELGLDVGQFSADDLQRLKQALPNAKLLIGGQRRVFGHE